MLHAYSLPIFMRTSNEARAQLELKRDKIVNRWTAAMKNNTIMTIMPSYTPLIIGYDTFD